MVEEWRKDKKGIGELIEDLGGEGYIDYRDLL